MIQFGRFLEEVDRANVTDVTIAASDIRGHLRTGAAFKTVMPMDYPELINMLRDRHVGITGEKPSQNPWFPALISWAPFFLQIAFWLFFMRPDAERLVLLNRSAGER